uniref:Uncharacterized protein n=1 Tax=Anopheles culicifacies TaxID=139723 RepID=A0A182MI50_9DIPT
MPVTHDRLFKRIISERSWGSYTYLCGCNLGPTLVADASHTYIDFLYRVLSNNEMPAMREEHKNMAVSGGNLQFSGSGILAHEKLSYLFSVWRMEGDWSNGSSGGEGADGGTGGKE